MAKKVNSRMTGKDYRREYNELNRGLESLKVHVTERLKELVRKYPDMPMPYIISNEWFGGISTLGMINYIEEIEKWSEEKQGVQQLKI